jgi:hypothetical protein
MKTRKLSLFVTILLMGAVFAAAGQPGRNGKNDNRGNENDKNKGYQLEKRDDYRNHAKFDHNQNRAERDIRYHDAKKKSAKNYSAYKSDNRYGVPEHFRGYKEYRYVPQYGHTVRHFKVKPEVYHGKKGKYYYHAGHFYNYRPGVGYIWIENPIGLVFNDLPYGAVRVSIHGAPYYRVGDVYMVHNRYGYEIVPVQVRPVSRPVIQISATF